MEESDDDDDDDDDEVQDQNDDDSAAEAKIDAVLKNLGLDKTAKVKDLMMKVIEKTCFGKPSFLFDPEFKDDNWTQFKNAFDEELQEERYNTILSKHLIRKLRS